MTPWNSVTGQTFRLLLLILAIGTVAASNAQAQGRAAGGVRGGGLAASSGGKLMYRGSHYSPGGSNSYLYRGGSNYGGYGVGLWPMYGSGYGYGYGTGYGGGTRYSSGYSGYSYPGTSSVPAASGSPYLTNQTYEPGDGYRYPLYYNPATATYFYYPVTR